MEIDESRMMTVRGGGIPIREEIVYSSNRMERFKREERRGLVIGRIGKLEIDVRNRLWNLAKGNRFEEFVRIYVED